ncbi:hypothetical protein DM02DRAFT_634836 [Periconia macrospinosa]|uniref:Zn(2)-C6 fungal-type domain-containing protein n=1 Tax=Periconia macrospinosa TaxID=97972 RepID=A0A2V1D519_9PLEO|nr:hypothetical protein DM02DRAFT_634836 [Periconia macrospinosa]
MSAASEGLQTSGDTSTTAGDGSRRKQSNQQQRQLLSCTKCRERKVKCDRTKPCSACCARGSPKECHFVAEGGDYTPIQQSYELRKLRAENLRLKERLRASRASVEDDESGVISPTSYLGDRQTSTKQKRRTVRQRRFQGPEWSDSLYFGSPGLANVIADFASINLASVSPQSLVHLIPRGSEMYTNKVPPPHPFPTMFPHTPDNCIPELLRCLRLEEARDELFEDLESFEKRVHICAFPYVPVEITKSEVERFLADPMKNAQMCPDMLALLFAVLALGSQHSAWDKSGGKWQADMTHQTLRKGDVYIAAAMQALRVASFMHKPTLLGIQTLIMMSPFLTNSGRFLDAWTLFGTTIRLAHSMGLHRHPKYLDPSPPTQRECFIRQTLWWWMLHMDQECSMTLGRPLGISGIGDCPPPHELTTDPRMLRFGEFVNHFTVLTRQILSSDCLTNAKIDEFTDLLKGLLDTMPEMLQFDASWLDETTDIPEWPLGTMAALFYCKTHTYLILLNRQRIEKHSSPRKMSSYFGPTGSSPTPSQPSLRGRDLVLSSSSDLLTAFLFFHVRVPAALISWTAGQQAFNACMILLLDAMETGDLTHIGQVERAYVVFIQLQNNGVHELAALAVERVSWGLAQLGRLKDQKNYSNDQSFEMPGLRRAGSGTAGGTREMDIQGTTTGESEANIVREKSLRDTVMGNTGMLLLEDPGLQSFIPEAFQPLAWNVEKEEWKKRLDSFVLNEKKGKAVKKQGERGGFGRSSEQSQGATTSPGSAPPRFATFDPAPAREQQEHQTLQPQGPTFSTPPHSSFSRSTAGDLHQIPPPHLRHHSYPSLQQVPSSLGRTQHQHMRGENLDTRIDKGNRGQSQPLLQALPEFRVSSTSATNPNVHPVETDRPAAIFSDYLRMVDQSSPAFMSPPSHRYASTNTWQYDMPHRMSSDAGSDSIIAPTYYSSANNVGGDQGGPRA